MKGIVVALAIALAALGAVCVRVVVAGRHALAAGDAAAARHDPREAIADWEAAARHYLPLAPHVDEAYARLVALAKADPKRAVLAWSAVRSAAVATRGLWTPHADDLAAANAQLAQLSAANPNGGAAAGDTLPARAAFYSERYGRDPRPAPLAIALAALGIAAWLGGIAVLVRRGIGAGGRLVRRPALVGAAVALAGLLGWAAGLYNA